MTILPHTVSKLLHSQVTNVARRSELIDSAARKVMQMHAEEIEVARRFWACPFQSLSTDGRTAVEQQFHSADANVAEPHIDDQPHVALQSAGPSHKGKMETIGRLE